MGIPGPVQPSPTPRWLNGSLGFFSALINSPVNNMEGYVDKKVKQEQTNKVCIKRHTWKSSEDKSLLNILKDQALNGGKEGTTFTKAAWREILASFNDARVDKLELQQLKNRHKYFRACYATMSKLLKYTGFGWDDDDKMIKAENDKWEELIQLLLPNSNQNITTLQKDNTVKEYRDKVWPSWPDLQEICATSTARGFCATSSKGKGSDLSSKTAVIDLNEEVEVQEIEDTEKHVSQVTSPSNSSHNNMKMTEKKMKSSNPNGSKTHDNPRGQKRTTDDAVNAIDSLADATSKIAEMKKRAAQQEEAYSVKSCMAILKSMNDVDPRKKGPMNSSQVLDDDLSDSEQLNCIGAIDGTHIDAKIKFEEQTPYRNRHGFPSQNVMAVVSFDMTFTYVVAGWEGPASHQAVLRWAVTSGGFNLTRAMQIPQFVAPYRGDRYHFGSFRGSNRHYKGEKDLFNHRHAQLRNVVERTFGVLKARFPILKVKGGIPYPYETQVKIVMACCIIHNFIRKATQNDELFGVYENLGMQENDDQGEQQKNGLLESVSMHALLDSCGLIINSVLRSHAQR
ncbi:hypothetical protein U9M48_037838 [Paspalum notatum var. saurae]|uniref:Myb/SANT-like domain-containing protein n=1 Tax=Paspalum notatum var. saurae TaxID=547442 RepID=A0AAQ3UM44_PASNO